MAFNVGSVSVDIVPDATGFKERLNAAVRNATVKVSAEFEANGVQEKIQAAAKDATATVNVKVDGERAASSKIDVVADKKRTAKVTVHVDDSEVRNLQALLAELEREKKGIQLKLDADTRPVKERIAELKAEIAKVTAEVEFKSNDAVLRQKLADLKRDLRGNENELKISTTSANAEIQKVDTEVVALKQNLETASLDLKARLDAAQAEADLQELQRQKLVELKAEVDRAHAEAQLEEITRQREIHFVVDIDQARAQAELEQLVRQQESGFITDKRAARSFADFENKRRQQEIHYVVDVDQARAEADLEQLKRDREVNFVVNVKEARAQADLENLQREREAKFVVDIDVARAEAELEDAARTRHAEIVLQTEKEAEAAAKIDFAARDRRTNITVDADRSSLDTMAGSAGIASGAIAAMVAVGASIGPVIVPAAAAAAGALVAIAPAALIGAGGIGTLISGLKGVAGAWQASTKATDAATTAAVKAGKEQESTAGRVAAAQSALQSAEASLANTRANAAEAARRAGRAIQDAQQGVKDASAQAAQGVEAAVSRQAAAERTLQGALAQEEQAQHGLSLARQQAKRDIEALTNAVQDGQLNQRQASLDVQQTYDALVASQDSGSRLERDAAQLAYDRAVQRQKELAQDQAKLVGDQKTAQQNGIEGNPAVVAAKQQIEAAKVAVADARRNAVEATKAISAARVAGNRAIAKAEQNLADAEHARTEQQRTSAFSVSQAQQGVTNAQRSLKDAQTKTAASTTAAAAAADLYKQKLAALTPEGRALAIFLNDKLRPGLHDVQQATESLISEGALTGLQAMRPLVAPLTGLVIQLAGAMGNLLESAGQALGGSFWVDYVDFLSTQAGPTLSEFGQIIGNILTGFAGMTQAFAPIADGIRDKLLEMTGSFRAFGTGQTNGLQSFLDYVQKVGPDVSRTFGAIFRAIGHLIEALAPIGGVMLHTLESISTVIANLPVDVLTGFVGALLLALSVGGGLVSLVSLLSAAGTAIEFLGSVFGRVALGAVGMIAMFVVLATRSDTFQAFLRNQVLPAVKELKPTFDELVRFVTDRFLPALKVLGEKGLAGMITSFNIVQDAVERNKPAFEQIGEAVKRFGNYIVDTLLPALGPILVGALETVGSLVGVLVDALGFLVKIAGIKEVGDALKFVAVMAGAVFLGFKAFQGISAFVAPLSGVLLKLGGAAQTASNNLLTMNGVATANQAAAGRLVGGFGRVATFLGGPWGVAIGLGATLLGGLIAKHIAAKNASQDWTKQLTFENDALDENSRKILASQIASDGSLASAVRAGIAAKDYTDALIDGGSARQAMIDQLGAIAAAHQVGADEFGRPIFDQIGNDALAASEKLKITGGNLDEQKRSAKLAADALHGVGSEAQRAAGGTDHFSRMAEAAKPKVRDLKDVSNDLKGAQTRLNTALQNSIDKFTILNGGALDQAEAGLRWQQALTGVTESVKDNGKSLDITTKAGQANREQLQGAVRDMNDKIKADFEAGLTAENFKEHLKKATGALKDNSGHLVDVAGKAGLSRTAVKKMLDQYVLTPDQLVTQVEASGVKGAQQAVKDYKGELDGIKDKKNTVETKFKFSAEKLAASVIRTSSGEIADYFNNPGAFQSKAQGGPIIRTQHRAFGGPVQNLSGRGRQAFDTEPAMLRVDEHVWTPEEVDAVGGHGAMFAMRKAAKSGRLRVGSYRNGGTVGNRLTSTFKTSKIPNDIGNLDLMANAFSKASGDILAKKVAAGVEKAAEALGLNSYGSPGPISGFSAGQMKNAATIASVGSSMGYRAQLIGIATAIVESGLRNLKGGDRDSVGLFQQRAPWGSFKDRTNPRVAAGMFYHGGRGGQRGLDDFNWQKLSPGAAAQAVQVSAFPGRYAQQMANAARILDAITNGGGVIGGETGGHRWPTNTRALSPNYRGHSGIDIRAGMGAPIWAASNGRIDYAGWGRGYGQAIFENSGGLPMVYGHTSKLLVRTGERVKVGQLIGKVGATGNASGPHLHFEIAPNGFDRASNRGKTLDWLRTGKYDNGGWLMPGTTIVHNATGRPEPVLNPQQWQAFEALAKRTGRGEAPVIHVEKIETTDARQVGASIEAQWRMREALYPSWN